jgi:hypothetical protein
MFKSLFGKGGTSGLMVPGPSNLNDADLIVKSPGQVNTMLPAVAYGEVVQRPPCHHSAPSRTDPYRVHASALHRVTATPRPQILQFPYAHILER